MNTGNPQQNAVLNRLTSLAVGAALLLQLSTSSSWAAAQPTLTDKTKEVVQETKVAAEDAGRSAAESARELWRRIDESRLKNRTPDEIVAWVIMGVLVGAVAGMLTGLKPAGLGKMGRLFGGLVGAFLGGMVVHVGRFDFGWGPVLIRYEELLFSLLGAVVLVVLAKVLFSRVKKKTPAP
jgi:uncharacterized membrane protein YeaQ/YmgE (transglycosylase-associated protein family)